MTDYSELFDDHIVSNPEVCVNCCRRVRRPRADPTRRGEHAWRRTDASPRVSATTRVRQTTAVGHYPTDPPTDDHATFCECGVAGTRVWERSRWQPAEEVRELATTLTETLSTLGVGHDRRVFLRRVVELTNRTDPPEKWRMTDAILDEALQAAVAAHAAGDTTSDREHTVAAD